MKVIASWNVDSKQIELVHENPEGQQKAHWEYRVDGEVRMHGFGRPREARAAVFTRRKLP